ncbi:hypothetical protein [Thermoflexus sp.]|uniref:hypothetical protein n=1 Tax=Thermoflexus sp. TaxID=1969742 RepID=UPI002ADDCCE1|nr:hypothetical protein [Thermoflexus sp.]
MRRIFAVVVGVSLGLALALGFGWAMARGVGAAPLGEEPTPTPTPTLPVTRVHPVALALARWISQTFPQAGITVTISVTDLMALQARGFGYGEIARALQLVLASQTDQDPANNLTLEQALTLGRQIGWGQAYRLYNLHPGGRGLGAIMRSLKPRSFATPSPAATPSLSAQGAPGFPPGLSKEKDNKPPRGIGRGRR